MLLRLYCYEITGNNILILKYFTDKYQMYVTKKESTYYIFGQLTLFKTVTNVTSRDNFVSLLFVSSNEKRVNFYLIHNNVPCRSILSNLITEPHLECFFLYLVYLFYLPQNKREKSLKALLGGKVFTIKTISMRNFTYKYLEIFPSNEFHYRTEFVSNYK